MHYQVVIAREVVLKLRYVLSSGHCKGSCSKVAVYIRKCSLQGKLLLGWRMYYQVFITRKVVLKLRYGFSSVHCKESWPKVAVCIIKCSLEGKLF